MEKSTLGFLLGFLFGIIGLWGMVFCLDKDDKDEFMSGWWKALITRIILVVIIVCLTTCTVCVKSPEHKVSIVIGAI